MIRVSGFTFIKNGLTLGYPILESIQSIDPLCDEVIINVGFDNPSLKDDDGTFDYLKSHLSNEKRYKFLRSYWDPSLRHGGQVLSQQTNIALQACQGKFCQYIQGDEALHEQDYSALEKRIHQMELDDRIEGLVFKYLHFYGNVDSLLYTRRVYRREVRLIRNGLGIQSWKDAQGFRLFSKSETGLSESRKIYCLPVKATVYHYGWARKEQVMAKKVKSFDKLYHNDETVQNMNKEEFVYRRIWGTKPFHHTHPEVMAKWILENKNPLDIHALALDLKFGDWRHMTTDLIEAVTGYRLGEYKNFKIL